MLARQHFRHILDFGLCYDRLRKYAKACSGEALQTESMSETSLMPNTGVAEKCHSPDTGE